jgi:transcriptional regulator with XRE-family HTH domain
MGYDQATAAAKLGMTRSEWCLLENGGRPGLVRAIKLHEICGVAPKEWAE